MKGYNENTGEYEPDPEPSGFGYGETLDQSQRDAAGELQRESKRAHGYTVAEADPGTLARFAEAAANFSRTLAEFLALPIAPDDPQYAEYQALAYRARTVQATMEGVGGALRDAWNFAKQSVGLASARRGARGSLKAVPLVAIAAVTGAIALLIGMSNSMMQFIVNWRRADAGKAPVPGSDAPGPLGELSGALKWIVIGGVLWFALPPILRQLEGRGE